MNETKHSVGERLMEVEGLARDALVKSATDVHVDPTEQGFRICYRVDGTVHEVGRLGLEDGRQLLNQIKVMARLAPERTLKPVESRFDFKAEDERKRDIRVTFVPTLGREAAHLRILSPPREIIDVQTLGLPKRSLRRVLAVLKSTEGLILIAGPTGAGKTMTLYSLVSLLDLEHLIAVSIEDPVEFDLPTVRQLDAQEEHGITMAGGLRALLRMDPDVILIGEVRDSESAASAVRAASSGKFVLATLHARDALASIESLQHLSVPRHLIASTLRLVLVQKLVRRMCPSCVRSRELEREERKRFRNAGVKVPKSIPVAKGCPACGHHGYKGRVGVFGSLELDEELKTAISSGASRKKLRTLIERKQDSTLEEDALRKVASGVTSLEEVERLHWPGGDELELNRPDYL